MSKLKRIGYCRNIILDNLICGFYYCKIAYDFWQYSHESGYSDEEIKNLLDCFYNYLACS